MHQGEGKILIEEVLEELAHADVGPPPVDQEQALQVAELCEGEVTGQDCLHPLLATDANPDVGSCNKRIDHVITYRVFTAPFLKLVTLHRTLFKFPHSLHKMLE